MKIGELATLAGVSVRTVRHYHQLGLLPDPARKVNGYRDYRLRDAVVLARVRRLAELGLALDDIRDELVGDATRDLRELLVELDSDLAAQERSIAARRVRLAALLADDVVDEDALSTVLAQLPTPNSTFAELDRQMLSLLDATVGADDRAAVLAILRSWTDPAAQERAAQFYERLDELADASTADPRIAALAHDLAEHLPPELAAGLVDADRRWLDLIAAEMSPAQAAVFTRLFDQNGER